MVQTVEHIIEEIAKTSGFDRIRALELYADIFFSKLDDERKRTGQTTFRFPDLTDDQVRVINQLLCRQKQDPNLEIKPTLKRKAVNGFIEFWSDTRYICGNPPPNPLFKRYLKAKTAAKIWEIIRTSPTDIQFFSHYTDTPLQLRRKWLDNSFFKFVAEFALYELALRISYGAIWLMIEGVKLIEIKEVLEQSIGIELAEVIFEEMTRQLGTKGVIKFRTDTLGLYPRSIAGANARLKGILQQRSMKQVELKSEYEQDLSVAIWQCSEGAYLNEFKKMLSDNGDLAEEVASLRQILKEKDHKALRSIMVRILRKAIEDLPDISEIVSDQRRQEEYLQKLNSRRRNQSEYFGGIFVRDEIVLKKIEAKQVELQEKLSHDEIIELLIKEGINKDDLTDKMWRVIFHLNDAFTEGIEMGSKKGMSLDTYFGANSAATRKQLSRLRKRVKILKAKKT